MDRQFYLDLARSGLRMPIGTDLVLHEKADPDRLVQDGQALGKVVEEAARRYRTPLALARMDLTLEKAVLCEALGVPAGAIPTLRFRDCPGEDVFRKVEERINGPLHPQLQAHVESVAYIAGRTDLVPVGMGIGPFSLMTKLLSDPITPIYLAGSGLGAEEDPDVRMMEVAQELSLRIVLHSDGLITREEVERLACELIRRMRETGHPFILGSECDVLSVPGCEQPIREKVEAFLRCVCD